MAFIPTDEQQQILEAFLRNDDLVIEAGAGSGKTRTLRLLSESTSRAGVYFAYNKAIADEAKMSFPPNVRCSTAHSLAFRSVGKPYASRLGGQRIPARVLAQRMGIYEPLELAENVKIAPVHVARIVTETIQRFCYSADDFVMDRHVPWQTGMLPEVFRELRTAITPIAQRIWQSTIQFDSALPFQHDYYLKIWGLSHPRLNTDFVLLDEAQDANPVLADIVEKQTHAQRILVGDANQAIYGWRGAIDAMSDFNGTRLYLSQSFRFGPAIADEANKWLSLLDSPLHIRGYDKIDSRIDFVERPDAVLCRTNAGAVAEAISAHNQGRRAALVGGGDQIRRLALAANDLQMSGHTDHPELFMFDSWDEVKEYVNEDAAGSDLKVFVKLIDQLGTSVVIQTVDQLVSEDIADVVISTAHKSKGREWETVRIAPDFYQPDEDKLPSREEMMLSYVTVTRAKIALDRGGLGYIDELLLTVQNSPATVGEVSQAVEPTEKEEKEMATATAKKSKAKEEKPAKATRAKAQVEEKPVQKPVATKKSSTSQSGGRAVEVTGKYKGHTVTGVMTVRDEGKPTVELTSWTLPDGKSAPKKVGVVGQSYKSPSAAGYAVFVAMNEHYGIPEKTTGRFMEFTSAEGAVGNRQARSSNAATAVAEKPARKGAVAKKPGRKGRARTILETTYGNGKEISQEGVSDGKVRFWCNACLTTFIAKSRDGEPPSKCTKGHKQGPLDESIEVDNSIDEDDEESDDDEDDDEDEDAILEDLE